MDSKTPTNILFWAVLGPFLVILALLISLMRADPATLLIPTLAAVSVPLALRFRGQGMIIQLVALGVGLLFVYSDLPPSDRFWQVGMCMAVMLTSVVTMLGFEEARQLLSGIGEESTGRLDQLWRLDEKHKSLQERWRFDREDYSVRNKLLSQELEEAHAQLQAAHKTIQIVRSEMEKKGADRQALLDELLGEKRKIRELEAQVLDAKEELQGVAVAPAEDIEFYQQQLRRLEVERDQLKESVLSMQAQKQPKTELEQELARAQGMYKQLREQFEEKDRVLHEARQDLFKSEGKLEVAHRRVDEAKKMEPRGEVRSLQSIVNRLEREALGKEEEIQALNQLVENLFEELAEKEKASS